MSHTPGPWTVIDPYGDEFGVQMGRTGGFLVPGANTEANARLIAAAPELLDTLRGLLAIPEVRQTAERSVFGSLVWAADDAIAKAEGLPAGRTR